MTWHDTGPEEPPRLGRRARAALVVAFLALAVAAVMSLVHLPYVVMSPGPIENTLGTTGSGTPLVEVTGARTYPTSGELDFTTVRVLGGPGAAVDGWDVLRGWLDPSSAVIDEDRVFPPGVTSSEVEKQNAAEMAGSQQEAIAVALRSLDVPVEERIVVVGVGPNAPSGDALRGGDEILRVDGTRVASVAAVQKAVRAHAAGEKVTLVVRRGGARREVTATTGDVAGQAALGVYLRSDFTFPYVVKIDAGNVGGPSAGMMFSLAVRDLLTPGAMTGGAKVAGTGTISDDGTVGPIGGVRQKLVGAERGGADWFLAPADNCGEVVGHVPDGLHVVRVGTYDDAVAAVSAIAGDRAGDLPTCTAPR